MYVILLDRQYVLMNMKFMSAVHARLAGNEGVEIPDLNDERAQWEEWLMSDPPKEAMRTKNESAVYAALFPDNMRGMSSEEAKKITTISKLRDEGFVTEVAERGTDTR